MGGNIKSYIIYPPAIKSNDTQWDTILKALHVNRESETVIATVYNSEKREIIKSKKFSFKNIDSNFQAYLIENDGNVVVTN